MFETRPHVASEDPVRSGFHRAIVKPPNGFGCHLSRPGRMTGISLKARNLVSDQLKVNDSRGNPIEIAAVVVWRIADTAQALFDVENYDNYVRIQIESAVRHLASQFAYDHDEDSTEMSLRGGSDQLLQVLHDELQARLNRAGVIVEEARLTHLAMVSNLLVVLCGESEARPVINTGTLYH